MRSKKIAAAAALLLAAFLLTACAGGTGGRGATPRPTQDARATVAPHETASSAPVESPGGAPSPGASDDGSAQPGESTRPGESAQPGESADPSEDPAGTGGIPAVTQPGGSAEPNGNGVLEMTIDGFAEGKVIDPSEIPLIGEALRAAFPEHTVQQASHEIWNGLETYRLVLQGEGELAKTVYMLADGSLLIPHGMK